MGKRILLSVAAVIVMVFACEADAQQRGTVPHVGILLPSSPTSSPDANLEAFRQGLRDLGYVDGRNITLEYRWAENREDQYPALVAELIRLKVDIIFTSSPPQSSLQSRRPIRFPSFFQLVAIP
jgi:putative ABC transport system substrate-binding protein